MGCPEDSHEITPAKYWGSWNPNNTKQILLPLHINLEIKKTDVFGEHAYMQPTRDYSQNKTSNSLNNKAGIKFTWDLR